jgi:hypothetical protein
MSAFVGHLSPSETLLLWDRIIGFDSLLPLPVLAAAVMTFRWASGVWLGCRCCKHGFWYQVLSDSFLGCTIFLRVLVMSILSLKWHNRQGKAWQSTLAGPTELIEQV